MEDLIAKARVLIEALPYIRNFYGKTVVIKYGGSAMMDEELKHDFALDVILMKYIGMRPVIVHGGGPQISEMLKRVGIESNFVSGMRVTDPKTMSVVEMVLGGSINKDIVNLINSRGGKAVGLTGKDGRMLLAHKMKVAVYNESGKEPELVDLGQVGEVESVNAEVIEAMQEDGFVPVIAPIGVGAEGESYNINADLVAVEVAIALKAEKLVFMTDVPGVLDNNQQLISTLTKQDAESLIADRVVSGGMIPKVNSCMHALKGGVKKTHIIDGRVNHALLLEIFTDRGVGSEILP